LLPWGCQTIMDLALEAVVVVTAATLATTGQTAERAAILIEGKSVVGACRYEKSMCEALFSAKKK